jgi:hypothetical protein
MLLVSVVCVRCEPTRDQLLGFPAMRRKKRDAAFVVIGAAARDARLPPNSLRTQNQVAATGARSFFKFKRSRPISIFRM